MNDMDFHAWFKKYRKSYDLRCAMTELHMEAAWEEAIKELKERFEKLEKQQSEWRPINSGSYNTGSV